MTFPFPTYLPTLAPPELVGTPTSKTANNVSSTILTLPTGIVAGERLFIEVTLDGGTARTISTPAGWNALYNDTGSGGLIRVALFTRIADGSEGSSITLSFSGGANVVALAWRVEGSVSNCEVAVGAAASTSSYTPPTLTPSSSGRLWLVTLHGSGTTTNPTDPTSWTRGAFDSWTNMSRSAFSAFDYKEETASSQSPGDWTATGSFPKKGATVAVW